MALPSSFSGILTLLLTLLSLLSLTTPTHAQTSASLPTTTTNTPATSTSIAPSLVPSTSAYTYQGCYSETLNTNTTNALRTLNGGVSEALDIMTVPLCAAFCKSNGYVYAGLEYTRECYCSKYLSALATKLEDSKCDLPCMGNATQVCGGSWTLSVYMADGGKKGGAGVVKEVSVWTMVLGFGVAAWGLGFGGMW